MTSRVPGFLLVCTLAVLTPPTTAVAAAELSEVDLQLSSSIGQNNVAQARAAIAAGASVNADLGEGRTPLIVAAMSIRPDMVRVLLEAGADPTRRADDIIIGNAVTAAFFAMNGVELTGRADEPDPQKRTAALEVLKLVAGRKVGLNLLVRRATQEFTALMIAAEAGALDAVQILIDAGADVNAMNGGKYTALDYAVDRAPGWSPAPAADRVAIVRALLAAGAKTNRKGADGVTPLERARRAGNAQIVSLLAAR